MTPRRPSTDEMARALEAARRMRAADVDPHHVALALEYFKARCDVLEALHEVTDRYLRFGMPEHELAEMHRLVNRLREQRQGDAGAAEVDDTLPL